MRTSGLVGLIVLLGSWAAVGSLLAADMEIKPNKIEVGKSERIELVVNPNSLWPKPRTEILHAWWCWDIDPRPPECERVYCDSPVPGDPICALSMKERGEDLVFGFQSQGLVQKSGGACGRTDFALQAVLEGGGISEAKGTVEIRCEK